MQLGLLSTIFYDNYLLFVFVIDCLKVFSSHRDNNMTLSETKNRSLFNYIFTNPVYLYFQSAVVFGPFFIMPFTIFSGFFLRYVDAPGFFKWLFHVSFLKHGLVGLVLSIFGMDRGKLPCSDIYCHYSYPKQFIEDQGCSKESYHVAVTMLFCTFVVVILSTYVILKFRLSRKW